ncbi:carbohydrate porin [Nannocystis bainbridge]|uniref:Carbohydrate porin n=1 Tax=Nannocystis bainbridge TaxID=2995303 RepID=A0ABT5DQH5_9BACT|nr:carbohydrate porin [Nannocystis bainbridge]MDC0715299.1 carbohydrate porin [Nannocystis bainbridge]
MRCDFPLLSLAVALLGVVAPAAAAQSPASPPTTSQPTASTPPVTPAEPEPAPEDSSAVPAPDAVPTASAAPTPAEAPPPTPVPEPAVKPDKPGSRGPHPHDPNSPPGLADGFHFGSYGRVIAGGDSTGRAGRNGDIVARGSRLDEANYAELELRREDYWKSTGAYTRIVATTAFATPIFHYNGQFSAALAIRNLYLEVRNAGVKGLSFWAGSRMYRGDDIYLLDFWPLDNLNTIGGGVGYTFKTGTELKFHAGLNQPTDPYYRQTILRPPAYNQFGSAEVAILDRQKLVSSLKLSHVWPIGDSGGVKGILYGELHYVPEGQREIESKVYEAVPKDKGFVGGAQVGAFTGKRSTYVNLTARFASGIAAYGELNAPRQLRPDRTATGAHELLVTLSGNWERGPFGLLMGSYYRQFRNASRSLDWDDLNEGIVIVRPQVWFAKIAGVALEASYQAQQRGVATESEPNLFKPVFAQMGRFGVIPFITPGGPGAFQRPQIRLIYLLTVRDGATRSFYPADDVFARRGVDHFIGVGAEWWFGSTSYFR